MELDVEGPPQRFFAALQVGRHPRFADRQQRTADGKDRQAGGKKCRGGFSLDPFRRSGRKPRGPELGFGVPESHRRSSAGEFCRCPVTLLRSFFQALERDRLQVFGNRAVEFGGTGRVVMNDLMHHHPGIAPERKLTGK